MMTLRVVEPMRACNGPLCNGQRKPWSEFYKTAHGGPRWVCKQCETHISAARQRERRRDNPEPMRAAARASYQRRKADPEWLAARRAYGREQAERRRRARGIPAGTSRGPTLLRVEPAPRLDAAPFVEWLRTLGPTSTAIADACGLGADRVRQYLGGNAATVSLDVVDRACLHADYPLDELYPLDQAA